MTSSPLLLVTLIGLTMVACAGPRLSVTPNALSGLQSANGVLELRVSLDPELLTENKSSGSAIVWDRNGYLVTAAHLFDGVQSTEFSFELRTNDIPLRAVLIERDPNFDVALLRVAPAADARRLTALQKNTRVPRLGESVWVVGHPRNEFRRDSKATVTAGVVSASDVELFQDGASLGTFHQTDAYANTGSSGGAVLDDQGAVIGMVVRILRDESSSWGGATYFVETSAIAKVVTPWLRKEAKKP